MSVHVCLQHKHGRDLVYKFLSFLTRHVGLEEHAFGLHGGQSLIDPVDGKAFWQIGWNPAMNSWISCALKPRVLFIFWEGRPRA